MNKRILAAALVMLLSMSGVASADPPTLNEPASDSSATEEVPAGRLLTDQYVASANETEVTRDFHVYLPSGYDAEGSVLYPSVVMMPYDGYSADWYLENGIEKRLNDLMAQPDTLPMVVFFPEFEEGDNYQALTAEMIKYVDGEYSIQPSTTARGVLGAGAGGHMAAISATTNLTTGENITAPGNPGFIAIGSVMGNFTDANETVTGSTNPWLGEGVTSGYTRLNALTAAQYNGTAAANGFYLYVNGGSDDPLTNRDGSTADLVKNLRAKSAFHPSRVNFTMKPGGHTPEFFMNYLAEALAGFSGRFLGIGGTAANLGLNDNTAAEPSIVRATGRTQSSNVAIAPDVDSFTIDYSLNTVTRKLARFAKDDATLGMDVKLVLMDSDTGEVTYTGTNNVADVTTSPEGAGDFIARSGEFVVPRANIPTSSAVSAEVYVSFMGADVLVSRYSLINERVPDATTIDLMGGWHFRAYKTGNSAVADDRVTNLIANEGSGQTMDWTQWPIVTPGLGWWDATFAKGSNVGNWSASWSGHAWYVREFFVPEDYGTENLLLSGGMFDEENIMYVNGEMVGALGYGTRRGGTQGGADFPADGAVGDGSNPWDVRVQYPIPSEVLKYGEMNTIYVRMRNSTGDGGWYEGPIGIYSPGGLRKDQGKAGDLASATDTALVKGLVNQQAELLRDGDLAGYAATVTGDFFQSGYNKDRWMEKVAGWLSTSEDGVIIEDRMPLYLQNEPEVYEDDGIFYYVTNRVVKNKTTEAVIATEEIELGYRIVDGKAEFAGLPQRQFYDRVGNQRIHVWLPESYFEPGNENRRYPVQFLGHGINSTADAWVIEKLHQLVDPAAKNGEIEETILVASDNGSGTNIAVENLVPHMDKHYRTIPDRRFRSAAGFSNGGSGVAGIITTAARSQLIGSYTRFSPAGGTGSHTNASIEFLKNASFFLACGNIDIYAAFVGTVTDSHKNLFNRGIEHHAEIGIGGHDSKFYIPLFVPQIKWHQEHAMPFGAGDEIPANAIQGTVGSSIQNDKDLVATYDVTVDAAIADYRATTTSAYNNSDLVDLDVTIPITANIIQGGNIVYSKTVLETVSGAANLEGEIAVPGGYVDLSKPYTIELRASVLDSSRLLDRTVPIEASATTRCVAGKVVLATTVTNTGDEEAVVSVTTDFGSKTNVSVAPGKSVSQAFSTRLAEIPEGTVSVDLVGSDDSVTAKYPIASCK